MTNQIQTSGRDLKALVFNIKRCSFEDGPGIRTTVFLKGCPLRCVWCCNPEGQESYPELQNRSVTKEFFERYMSVKEVMEIFKADLPFFEASKGGVTIAGGEPTMQYEFVHELLHMCRLNNIHTALDTCGWSQGKSTELLNEADLLLYDVKLLVEDEHIRFTQITNRPILENLKRVARIGKSIIVRIPIVPGYTDSDENILGIGKLLRSLKTIQRVDLIAFHRFAVTKYAALNKKQILDSIPQPSKAEMLRIKSMLEGIGLKVQIGG